MSSNTRRRNLLRASVRRPHPPPPAGKRLAMLKDGLEVAWKLAPVFLVFPGLVLWFYLSAIHWGSLFVESATSISGLIFLIVFGMMFFGVTVLSFVLPSAFMIWAEEIYSPDRKIPKEIIPLFAWTLGAWLVSSPLVMLTGTTRFAWLALVVPVIIAFIYASTRFDKLEFGLRTQRFRLIGIAKCLAIAAVATLAVASNILSILLSLMFASDWKGVSSAMQVVAIVLCLAVTALGTVPGFIYLLQRTRHTDKKVVWAPALVCVGMVAMMILVAWTFLPQMHDTFLRYANIYRKEAVTFHVLDEDLVASLGLAGLPVATQGKTSTVKAYVRYQFGGVHLLCRDSVDAAAAAPKPKPAQQDPSAETRSGRACVPASSDDLREVRKPAATEAGAQP